MNTLHLYISGSPTLTAIGEEGTSYLASVPESSSLLLMAGGLIAMIRARARR